MYPLSKEQQFFVQGVLVQALMRAYQRQKSGKDASGAKLTRKDRSELELPFFRGERLPSRRSATYVF